MAYPENNWKGVVMSWSSLTTNNTFVSLDPGVWDGNDGVKITVGPSGRAVLILMRLISWVDRPCQYHFDTFHEMVHLSAKLGTHTTCLLPPIRGQMWRLDRQNPPLCTVAWWPDDSVRGLLFWLQCWRRSLSIYAAPSAKWNVKIFLAATVSWQGLQFL